jgi:hypothetical protein
MMVNIVYLVLSFINLVFFYVCLITGVMLITNHMANSLLSPHIKHIAGFTIIALGFILGLVFRFLTKLLKRGMNMLVDIADGLHDQRQNRSTSQTPQLTATL